MIIFILSFGYNYGYAINLVQTMYAANSKIVNGKDNNKNDFPCAFVLFLLLFFFAVSSPLEPFGSRCIDV